MIAGKNFFSEGRFMELNAKKDLYFMQEALKEARKAFERGEVPVGAVVVIQDKIIARGHNQVELLKDATAHAEMLALSVAFAFVQDWRLTEATLYCTLEPCLMCAGAMFSSRLGRLVWGAKDLRLGAGGSFLDLFQIKHPMHTISVTKEILADESTRLLKLFFQRQRQKKAGGVSVADGSRAF
ncbi:MAG: tRNA adenosine(34) deaminase TadA [Parachlamydiales bacterium]|jgi:tRNA(adenine34) deaminase